MEKNTMKSVKLHRVATLLVERTGNDVKSISLSCEVSGGRMCVICNVNTDLKTYQNELRTRFSEYGIKLQTIQLQLN